MKWYEHLARCFIGFWTLICAVDGWAYLLFDVHIADHKGFIFVEYLVQATYFWVFLKSIQLIGAISLLTNYKPLFGFTILLPINAVLILFYFFELRDFAWAGVLLGVSILILFRTYSAFYKGLFKPIVQNT